MAQLRLAFDDAPGLLVASDFGLALAALANIYDRTAREPVVVDRGVDANGGPLKVWSLNYGSPLDLVLAGDPAVLAFLAGGTAVALGRPAKTIERLLPSIERLLSMRSRVKADRAKFDADAARSRLDEQRALAAAQAECRLALPSKDGAMTLEEIATSINSEVVPVLGPARNPVER